ncbi:hypothetical protein E2C01_038758 [Portunus trituberculatus]|uniref:Uncharacterized protein n=1 Tax=Portunus trituberculatus TaxID=210409 RepID=A0A5B7FIW0_PORTR|nr:hypothetical protein [Portunus trituberculatus]
MAESNLATNLLGCSWRRLAPPLMDLQALREESPAAPFAGYQLGLREATTATTTSVSLNSVTVTIPS